ncbi:MAG TPA: radical SAM protein [Candidatus Udaeobacter sp.]|nr:radical SAM protein [Candidatus Udaeobacter sp.]
MRSGAGRGRFARTKAYEWVNWQLQTLSLTTGRSLSRPTFVCIKLTMRCNARCLHCNIHRPEHTPPNELAAGEWSEVLVRLRRWLGPGAPLTITGGEMFLRRDAFEVLERAADLGFALHLLTNGWLVDEARAERLMGLGARIVQVSLDGARPKTHDFLRGLPTFGERTEAALVRLAAARRRLRSPTRLVVAAVIFQQNLAELGALVRKVRDLGWDTVKFQPIEQTYMEPEDPAWYRRSPLWVTDPEAASRAIDQLIGLKRQGWPIMNSVEHLEFMKHYFRDPGQTYSKVRSHDRQLESRHCRAAVSDFDIASNGDVRLCYRMDPIGNVRSADPQDIWERRSRCWTSTCGYLDPPR